MYRHPQDSNVAIVILGLVALGMYLGIAPALEHHTTYINGSRVQTPQLNVTGNVSIGASSSTYLDNGRVSALSLNASSATGNATIGDTLYLFGNGTIRGGLLGGAFNAAGFAFNNGVIGNATILNTTDIEYKLTTISLVPRNSNGTSFTPGTTHAEQDNTYRTNVDFNNTVWNWTRFVADVKGTNNSAGNGKCLSIVVTPGGGILVAPQCWSGSGRIQQLVSNWTNINVQAGQLSSDVSLLFKLNASDAFENITIKGLEVQLR